MITDSLKVLLANHIEASLVVQGFHWNIEGLNFQQFHDFFGEVYEVYYSQVDNLAEYIRIVSVATEYVNASVDVVSTNKTITARVVVGPQPVDMTKEIIKINDAILFGFKQLFEEANNTQQDGLADYCAGRIDCLNKLKWKLIAITK